MECTLNTTYHQTCPCLVICCVQGAFHDNFPRFLGFGFCRKLVSTKTQQGTYKERKHIGRTVFYHYHALLLWKLIGVVSTLSYHLSSLSYTYSQFLSPSLFASTFATDRVQRPLRLYGITISYYCVYLWLPTRPIWRKLFPSPLPTSLSNYRAYIDATAVRYRLPRIASRCWQWDFKILPLLYEPWPAPYRIKFICVCPHPPPPHTHIHTHIPPKVRNIPPPIPERRWKIRRQQWGFGRIIGGRSFRILSIDWYWYRSRVRLQFIS